MTSVAVTEPPLLTLIEVKIDDPVSQEVSEDRLWKEKSHKLPSHFIAWGLGRLSSTSLMSLNCTSMEPPLWRFQVFGPSP